MAVQQQSGSLRKAPMYVLITGRRPVPLKETEDKHPNIISFSADVSQPDDAPKTITKAIELWGRIDILVNNAGAGAHIPLEDVTTGKIKSIFATNVIGPSLLAKAALPYLKATQGSIINISSTFGHKATGILAITLQARRPLNI